ncbi:S-adenosylmethionine mitochondrial carrier protein [Liparis tanakae]|uniref:S-adenosylmethionine mitochondrial carrier protein n=1 Tax=Liparis tanakae TaxID=230148 RepID=A0A4Z2F2N6_9TELE|nr:S-adenosylmethionine mitochondrial carrier protein [Liparis tanakae]
MPHCTKINPSRQNEEVKKRRAAIHNVGIVMAIDARSSLRTPVIYLFAGSIPRTAFISVGGFIFLGAYEEARRSLMTVRGP